MKIKYRIWNYFGRKKNVFNSGILRSDEYLILYSQETLNSC